MNIATTAQTGECFGSHVEVVIASLEAMPRARNLGSMALDLCNETDRKVMSGRNFVIAARQATASIMRWAKDAPLPRAVEAFCEASDEELMELQKKNRFSKIQLIQWTGEMKLQLFEARRASQQQAD